MEPALVTKFYVCADDAVWPYLAARADLRAGINHCRGMDRVRHEYELAFNDTEHHFRLADDFLADAAHAFCLADLAA